MTDHGFIGVLLFCLAALTGVLVVLIWEVGRLRVRRLEAVWVFADTAERAWASLSD